LYTILGEYYLGCFRNHVDVQVSLILMNAKTMSVSFTIEAPGVGFYHSGFVNGDSSTIVTLPISLSVFSDGNSHKGVYLKVDSDALIVTGQNMLQHSTDTFFALPYVRSSATTEYVYYAIALRGISISLQSAILIVGTEDSTTIRIKVTQTATITPGGTLNPGREYSFFINRLFTFYIRAVEDLTGTKIVTDKQVTVYSGAECANIPTGVCCCDTVVEQVPPVSSWGKIFYTIPLLRQVAHTVKILAAHNLTEIDIYCNNIKESHYTVNEGQYSIELLSNQMRCAIYSSKPVLVVQFGHSGSDGNGDIGDPMMMTIPSTLQYSADFLFTTLQNPSQSNFMHYINVVVLANYYQPNNIQLISGGSSTPLNTQTWVPVRVNNVTEAYTTQVTISEGVYEIVHSNKAALMTVNIYGNARYEGYGHPGKILLLTYAGLFHYYYQWFVCMKCCECYCYVTCAMFLLQ